MKALSIKQPWAHLIASGIKDIENRAWRTNFRGRIYIHAPAKIVYYKELSLVQLKAIEAKDISLLKDVVEKRFVTSAIIGEVDIIDCVINHGSIWADKTPFGQIGNLIIHPDKPIWNWVLANPVLYDKPILNVKGKLSFWEFRELIECRCCGNNETNEELYICQICEQEFCGNCQVPYNQFSQIDYPCCSDCGSRDDRD